MARCLKRDIAHQRNIRTRRLTPCPPRRSLLCTYPSSRVRSTETRWLIWIWTLLLLVPLRCFTKSYFTSSPARSSLKQPLTRYTLRSKSPTDRMTYSYITCSVDQDCPGSRRRGRSSASTTINPIEDHDRLRRSDAHHRGRHRLCGILRSGGFDGPSCDAWMGSGECSEEPARSPPAFHSRSPILLLQCDGYDGGTSGWRQGSYMWRYCCDGRSVYEPTDQVHNAHRSTQYGQCTYRIATGAIAFS